MYKVTLAAITAVFALSACEFEVPGRFSKTGKTEKFLFQDKFYTAEEFAQALEDFKTLSNPPRRAEFDLSTRFYQVKVQGSPVKCDAPSVNSCKLAIESYQTKMQRQSGMGY
ncbi:hypothetical protein [uncultured Litoreibacter sp.]|uniref:hypothetical protein n=1 Tax=uncultured Litoreibacter sp. TaxID=1392394 RepID=UPI002634A025|nr:hypothetical protein [uncultured Litoreibacter sp.]